MKQLLCSIFMCVIWMLTGCQTFQPSAVSTASGADQGKMEFRLRLNSDPPDAHANIVNGDRILRGRQTPGDLIFHFEQVPERTQLGWVRQVWRPVLPEISPWTVREEPDAYVLKLDRLELQRDGYQDETVNFTWRIPRNMRAPDEWGIHRLPVDTRREHTVVLRNPSRPHFAREITLNSGYGEGRIYALGSGTSPGRLLGETPLKLQIGVAPIRDQYGRIVDWRLWERDGIWKLDSKGILTLSAMLETPGFENEVFVNKPVLMMEGSRVAEHEVTLVPLRPSQPQFEFRLLLDSLPTGAGLYLLRPNGTLGQKLGVTPVEIIIGIAQELQQTSAGIAHRQWVLWAPDTVIDMEERQVGVADVFLRGVLFREGLSPEFVQNQLIQLVAGMPVPEEMTLTIPIYAPGDPRARLPGPATVGRPVDRPNFNHQMAEQEPAQRSEEIREEEPSGVRGFLRRLNWNERDK